MLTINIGMHFFIFNLFQVGENLTEVVSDNKNAALDIYF